MKTLYNDEFAENVSVTQSGDGAGNVIQCTAAHNF